MKKKPLTPSKYTLYEASVQSPEVHLFWYQKIFYELFGQSARHLREDFCGTFWLACEWVKADPKFSATALDLDPEPLEYGKKHHWTKLTPTQRRRLTVLRRNVISVTRPKADLIVAGNFSFCTFKDRKTLVNYFTKARESLNQQGALVLELAGGTGMMQPMRERKTARAGKLKFQYTWHQRSFDPIQRNGQYAIHFKLPGGQLLKNAFTYDWRMWTIPEVRDAMLEAGFDDTAVYWETEHKGEGTGEFVRMEKGDNAFAWICYVAALKNSRA